MTFKVLEISGFGLFHIKQSCAWKLSWVMSLPYGLYDPTALRQRTRTSKTQQAKYLNEV